MAQIFANSACPPSSFQKGRKIPTNSVDLGEQSDLGPYYLLEMYRDVLNRSTLVARLDLRYLMQFLKTASLFENGTATFSAS